MAANETDPSAFAPNHISYPLDGDTDVPKPLQVNGTVSSSCTNPQVRITYTVGGVPNPPVTTNVMPDGSGNFSYTDFATPGNATNAYVEILCNGNTAVDSNVTFA
jgi:hypothetical protein